MLEGEEFACPEGQACPPSRHWFADGKLHMIVERNGADQHFIVFYPNGNQQEDYHTVDGEVLRWYENGLPMFQGQVRHGDGVEIKSGR